MGVHPAATASGVRRIDDASASSGPEDAPSCLLNALRQACAELDALPWWPTPGQVRACELRRRLLDLRLLMDFNAFVYDPRLLKVYRGAIDVAYETLGAYKDVDVAEEVLGEALHPDLVERRLLKMNLALAPLRSPELRQALAGFLAAPSPILHLPSRKDVPRLWALAQAFPSKENDPVGNLAQLGHHLLRHLRAQIHTVTDICDPEQQERLHDVRKAARSIVILDHLLAAALGGAEDFLAPLRTVLSSYCDVQDCVVAYQAARVIGHRVDECEDTLRATFADAQAEVQQVLEDGSYDRLIQRLRLLEQERRGACQAQAITRVAA
jgi:hypothetical protein